MSVANWVLEYAGIMLPPPVRAGLRYRLEPIGEYDRAANDWMLIDEGALKRVVTAEWELLDGVEAMRIYNTLVNNRAGLLRYHDIALNIIANMQVFYGAGTEIVMQTFHDSSIHQRYENSRVVFIER